MISWIVYGPKSVKDWSLWVWTGPNSGLVWTEDRTAVLKQSSPRSVPVPVLHVQISPVPVPVSVLAEADILRTTGLDWSSKKTGPVQRTSLLA